MKKYLLGRYRLNRARYWKYIAKISMLLSLVWIVYVVATGGLPLLNAGRIFITILSSFFITILLVIPLNLARLHDFGYSGWKIVKYYLIFLGFHFLADWSLDQAYEYERIVGKISTYSREQAEMYRNLAGAVIIILIVRLSKKGQHYANKWGVNPNDKYEGEYNNGKRNGEGTCYFANGEIYIGKFKDNHMHGKGIYKHTNGTIDEGFWEDDNFIGKEGLNKT